MRYYHEALCGERIVLFVTENRLTLRFLRKQSETCRCPSKTDKYLDYKKVLSFLCFQLNSSALTENRSNNDKLVCIHL